MKPLGFIDDQPITHIPRRCTMLVARYWHGAYDGTFRCGGQVRPDRGFYKCSLCGISWGPVKRRRRKRGR